MTSNRVDDERPLTRVPQTDDKRWWQDIEWTDVAVVALVVLMMLLVASQVWRPNMIPH